MNRNLPMIALLGGAVLATALCVTACDDSRGAALAGKLDLAAQCEQERRFHDATRVYTELLAGDLTRVERADVRYRLARCRIQGDDLNGALAVLEELTEEDVKEQQMDIGPLYLELGDAWFSKGDRKKAQLAWQLGRGVSPARFVDFNRRIEQNLLPPEAPPVKDTANSSAADPQDGGR